MSDAGREQETRWLLRLGAGDRGEPLAGLHRALARPIHAIGLRTLRDAGAAEELVQDTFVRVWRSAPSFDPGRGSARAFIFTIARRSAIDALRRMRARPPLAAHEADDVSAGDDMAEDVVRAFALREAVEALPGKHREVIELSFDEDLSDAQISEKLGIPVGTVRSRTFYALRALRDELEEDGRLG